MNRIGLLLLFCAAALTCVMAQVQQTTSLIVEVGHSAFFTRPGVTAAYSMDSNTVDAAAVAGGFQLVGKMPGTATVVLVTVQGTHTISVTVPENRKLRALQNQDFQAGEQTVESGEYEFRYNNSPNQITNVQNVTQLQGDRTIHVEVMNTNLFPAGGQEPIGFPMLSYEISTPGRRITLVDKMMNNSDLTMSGILLRGLHVEKGPWEFHAGVTSITEFQDFLLPSNRYEVAGISRHFKLNAHARLEGNFYYFKTDTSVNTNATTGGIGTLLYQFGKGEGLHYSAEVGIGNGLALAGNFDHDTVRQQLHADFHYQSPKVASLSINMLHGRTANLNWHYKVGRRLQLQAFASDTAINLSTERQQVDSTTLNQTYWVTPHLGFNAGFTASRFVAILPSAPSVRSQGYLLGPQLLWKHFGGSFQYQQLRNSGTTPGSNNFQYSVQGSARHVSISGFYDSQTETPVFAPVVSAQTDLRDLLRHETAAALSPAQMSQLVRDTSVLTAQGYIAPLTVGVVARRQQYGATIDWSSEKAGHLSFTSLVNTSSGGQLASMRMVTGGVIWTRKYGSSNLLNAGFSLYRSSTGGQSSMQPVEQVSFQHQLNSVPRWLVPGRRGKIDGHVFVDKNFQQNYAAGDRPLADVLVYLDGRRSTHTDRNGYYVFRGVPWGIHRVEADYRSAQAFYYTSSSPKSVTTGGAADFGLSFAKGRLFGSFVNDAGEGMAVSLQISGGGIQREASTDGDGNIEVDGLPDGAYTIHPDFSSLPPGYSAADLDDQTVPVSAQKAGHFEFRIQAQRSVSGQVRLYDPTTGKATPLAGALVTITQSGKSMHTDAHGRYLFRQLASGACTVSVQYDGKSYTKAVYLATTPDIQRSVDIVITHASQALPPRPDPGDVGKTRPATPQRHADA